jgi:hypothetical protein
MRYPPILPDDYAPFDPQPRRAAPQQPPPPQVLTPPPKLADPHGMPTKHMHVKWNAWELEQIARAARRESVPMTTYVRRLVRRQLLAEAKL